jgi:hypothetical protein
MGDPILDSLMNRPELKFNDIIKRGYSHELNGAIDLMDKILDAVINSKDGSDIFTYHGYDVMNPLEDLEDVIGNGKQKATVDITPSDVRKYMLHFRFEDTPIDKSIYLLAPHADSSIRVSGNKLYLMPVWTDPIISPNPTGNGVFAKLFGGKYNVINESVSVNINGNAEIKTFAYINQFYNISRLKQQISKKYRYLNTPLVLYPLMKYGLIYSVEEFGHATYGKDFIISDKPLDNIDLDKYDVITTLGHQHPKIKDTYPERHTLHFYIKKGSHIFNYKLAYSLIYVFDAYPDRAKEIYRAIGTGKELSRWQIVLGEITFKGSLTTAGMLDTLANHINKIEGYIDNVTREQLAELDIHVNDIYDFIVFLITNFDSMVRAAKVYTNVFKKKRLELMYYVMYGIIVNINKAVDEIYRHRRQNSLTERSLNYILKSYFSPRQIFNITKSSKQILPIAQFTSVNDNMATKITKNVELQERADGVSRASGNSGASSTKQFPYSVRALNAMALVAGTVTHYPKNCPTPWRTLSPFVRLKPNGGIIIPDDLVELVDSIDAALRNDLSREDTNIKMIEVESADSDI